MGDNWTTIGVLSLPTLNILADLNGFSHLFILLNEFILTSAGTIHRRVGPRRIYRTHDRDGRSRGAGESE